MRGVLFAILLVHGLIHGLGFARAFGLAVPRLRAVSRPVGILWLAAGLALVVAAGLLLAAVSWWWSVALLGAVLSQILVVSMWSEAKYGTVANVVVLAFAIHGLASHGPPSFRAEYRDAIATRLRGQTTASILREADLAPLPEPVRCWVRASGALGRPRPTHFEATWRGRIRGSAEDDWMEFTAQQHNFLDEPARVFLMHASRGGLPVDVLHIFRGDRATMRVRLLSLVPLVDAHGPDITRAETVTLLNDVSVLAPGALVDSAIAWESIDARSARAHYTVGSNTVSAVLVFDDACELVDFISDDRLVASADGESFTRQRWSTPLWHYRNFGSHRAATRAEARWHPPAGAFTYLEIELVSLQIE